MNKQIPDDPLIGKMFLCKGDNLNTVLEHDNEVMLILKKQGDNEYQSLGDIFSVYLTIAARYTTVFRMTIKTWIEQGRISEI